MLGPGTGRHIVGGGLDATVKVTLASGAFASMFEIVVPPGYDVGAHVHGQGEEVFYVTEGELDILAFEPLDRTLPDWHDWTSASGQHYLRGGPGSFLHVPANTPHAFANRSDQPTRMFFQSSISGGHEIYFDELAAILQGSDGRPDQDDIDALDRKNDITMLTQLHDGQA